MLRSSTIIFIYIYFFLAVFPVYIFNPSAMNNSSGQTIDLIDGLSILRHVIFYTCSFIGLIFNITICVVIWNRKHLRQPLNLLIANLALADIGSCIMSIYSSTLVVLAIYNPQIYKKLPLIYYNNICKSVNFLTLISASGSMMTLAVISLERFRGIIYPLKLQLRRSQTKFIIAFVWIYSSAVAALFVCFSSYEKQEVIECSAVLSNHISITQSIFTIISSIMSCVVPLSIIIPCYISIAIKICRKSLPMDDSEYKIKVMKSISKRNRCIIILLIITVISSLAYCPFLGILNWILVGKLIDPHFHFKLTRSSWVLFLVSSIVMLLPILLNPILYNIANSQLKKEIKLLLWKVKFGLCSITLIRSRAFETTI